MLSSNILKGMHFWLTHDLRYGGEEGLESNFTEERLAELRDVPLVLENVGNRLVFQGDRRLI